jgi:hypothetical protein
MSGMNRYEGKDRRRERMRNHIAKDLRQGPKYAQRIVPSKRRRDENDDYYQQEYED